MSYQVLASKWRPRLFSEMVGQEHVLRALINALNNSRVHHAFLFTGTRGVGKTTVARILAKSLNCEQGVSAQPCGRCSACQAIDAGKFVDLIEVDAASRTKVEDTRELLDNVQYAPALGRYKIYLIDEVHMLSTHSFNALLKTLEEPPAHVKFLLATTDPQKLPVTILSRCLQFNLKPIPLDSIRDYLMAVLEKEKIGPPPLEAVTAIARAAAGSMRDALSLLDQALAYCNQELKETEVHAMLGTVKQDYLNRLLQCLAQGDAAGLCRLIEQMAETAPDYDLLLSDLTSLLHRVALAQFAPDAVDDWYEDRQQLLALAEAVPEEDIQLYYQIALHGRRDLPLAPDPRTGFEMIMLRMLAFTPADGPVIRQPAPTQPAAVSAATQPATPQGAAVQPPVQRDADSAVYWAQLTEAMQLTGPTRQLANFCTLAECSDEHLVLALDPKYQHICNSMSQKRLAEALKGVLGREVRLEVRLQAPAQETPVQMQQRAQQEQHMKAVEAIEQDATVQELKNIFDAKIRPELVQAVGTKEDE